MPTHQRICPSTPSRSAAGRSEAVTHSARGGTHDDKPCSRLALQSASLPIQLVPMSTPAPPVLTVRYDASERTFAAGNDVVIGRDLRADVRVAHPLISRAHLVVRFDQGRWIAIDNGSLNGMYVNNRRVPYVDIQDGQRINIGNPDGPALTFEVGRHRGSAGRPPLTTSIPLTIAPGGPAGAAAGRHVLARPASTVSADHNADAADVSAQRPAAGPPAQRATDAIPGQRAAARPTVQRAAAGAADLPATDAPPPAPAAPVSGRPGGDQSNLATSMMKILRPGRAPAADDAGCHQSRPRQRQRHRHSRCAGWPPPRHPGADAGRHRDRGQPQHQRHLRQRHPGRAGAAARRRRRHDRQHRPRLRRRHAGTPRGDRGGDAARAASTCAGWRGRSTTTRRCWTTSR